MSIGKEIRELLKWHPEMLLISRFPPTLEGFLNVSEKLTVNSKTFVKIKLTIPLFPSLENMTICVRDFEFLSSIDLRKITMNLLRSETSICSFLKQLKETLISKAELAFYQNKKPELAPVSYETMTSKLLDLRNLLLKYSEIQTLSSYNLNTIKLMINGVSTILQKDQGQLWKIVYSEVPSISGQRSPLPLSYICDLFIKQMDAFDGIWTQLKELDMNCWIIDPVLPKPYHLYRRIYLTRSLSVLVTLDLQSPLPNVQFLGCESSVSQYREKVSDMAQTWDCESSLLQNLCELLEINEFPKQPDVRSIEAEGGLVAEEECCICFLKELDDDNELPNVLCSNVRCNKHYHLSCLQQWLESNGKQSAFDQIHGVCLNCGENISCKL